MSPVRTPKNHNLSFTGKFPSLKMKRMIHFESGVEKDFIYLLEYDGQITSYEEQPIRIEYQLEGKTHTYTPDFQATVSGEIWVYECKPEKFVRKGDNPMKFEIADKWCQSQGWGFQVITAELIRSGFRLKNVKYLTHFSRFTISPILTSKIFDILQDKSAMRLIDVAKHLPEYSDKEVYPALFYMAYHHQLSLPIDDALISTETEIRLSL